MKFIIESSKTPIYNRIAISFVTTLRKFGHEVLFIDPFEFSSDEFIKTINNISIDYYISTNDNNYINQFYFEKDVFIFEAIVHKIVCIHHDSSFCKPGGFLEITKHLFALKRNDSRIFHFFIEQSNKVNFELIGIRNCHLIQHASEFECHSALTTSYRHEVCFVGHLMASLSAYPKDHLIASHHMISLAWQRTCHSTFKIQPEIWKLANDPVFSKSLDNSTHEPLAIFHFLLHEITKLSMAYRGELIGKVKNAEVVIYGGDLSQGQINDPLLKITQSNIKYLPPTSNYKLTESIYFQSKINLNLSSLQFDDAINNRIIDVVMSGGFLITDKRSTLLALCPSSEVICFDSPEEMLFLIDFFSHKDNYKKYLEVKHAIYNEVRDQFTYDNAIGNIIEKLKSN